MSRVSHSQSYQSQRLHKGPALNTNVLNSQESECLLASFPNTRLSYETTIHKNDKPSFFSGMYKCFILPKGKRCVAWITEWNRRKVVMMIDVVGANNYQGSFSPVIRKFHQENGWYPGSIRVYDACVDHSLVYGTVFSGVIFRVNVATSPTSSCDKTFFSIHTVYWYQGNSIPSLTLTGHVRLCERIFAESGIRQIAYTKQNSIIFGLPILCDDDKNIEAIARDLPYPIFAVQYRFENNTRVCQRLFSVQNETNESSLSLINMATPLSQPLPQPQLKPQSHPPISLPSSVTVTPSFNHPPVNTSRLLKQQYNSRVPFIQPSDDMLTNIQAIFVVRPNIQNDIYELFVKSSSSRTGEVVFHNFAHISGYKTSVMMNRLFRNIVENECLDTQEESEDESEFENTEPDKYVSLHKEYIMLCRFNKRFCKWVPMHIISAQSTMNSQVITDQQVKQHEMRYLKHNRK
jgi:hypothetical protein